MDDVKIVTIDGVEYQIRKLNAFKQMHMARKLSGCFAGAAADKSDPVQAAILGLSTMPDAQAEDVLLCLLQGVYRKEPKGLGWAPVVGKSGLMFEDLDLFALGELAVENIRLNLANFIKRLQSLKDLQKLMQMQTGKASNS